MKLTKETLKRIIKEELNSLMSEGRDMTPDELNRFRQQIADKAGNIKYYIENKKDPATILYDIDPSRGSMYNIAAQLKDKDKATFNYNKLESTFQTVLMPAMKELQQYLTSGLSEENKRLFASEAKQCLRIVAEILKFSN